MEDFRYIPIVIIPVAYFAVDALKDMRGLARAFCISWIVCFAILCATMEIVIAKWG
jgi:hypothetical protein